MNLIPKNEIDEAAWASINPPINFETPDVSDGYNEHEILISFKAGVEFAESKLENYFKDVIIENQGLKLYKDNETKRFEELAIEFAEWIKENNEGGIPIYAIWLTYKISTDTLFQKFIKEKNND